MRIAPRTLDRTLILSHNGLTALPEEVGALQDLRVLEVQHNKIGPRLPASLATLPGYREDPLAKKAMMLAVVLGNRPERFLRAVDRDSLGPIVDYHIMRGCLRTGCVRIHDDGLRQRLEARSWVESGQEAAVREATLEAMGRLCERSGLGVDAVDGFFFVNGRTRCLEGEAPHCSPCPVREDCARHEELFQPIFRTTSY